jgi:hypothetical protein
MPLERQSWKMKSSRCRGEESNESITRNNVSKQVLAFYYGWYGNPEVSKRW